MIKQIINLKNIVEKNNKEVKKLKRLIYIYKNNIKLYKGKNGGYYYCTKNSIIYL